MKTKQPQNKLKSGALATMLSLALALSAAGGFSGLPGKGDPRVFLRGTDNPTAPATAAEPAREATLSAVMRLRLVCVCLHNDHVGKEWGHDFCIDGVRVTDGCEVTLEAGRMIAIYTEITEYDDAMNDVAADECSQPITAEDLLNGFSVERLIEVVENGGRYKGNAAVWRVVYTFMP